MRHSQDRSTSSTSLNSLSQKDRPAPQPSGLDWNLHGPDSPNSLHLDHASEQTFRRALGPTEASYYLASRGEGVNDMYLHIGFDASPEQMTRERITQIWAEILRRHQLLASSVRFRSYEDISFVYTPPNDSYEALMQAQERLELRDSQNYKDVLDEYLNGYRTLSDFYLSRLIISTPSLTFNSLSAEPQRYDFFLLSTHFIGDGMALHTTANEFFQLLSFDTRCSIEKVLSEREEPKIEDVQTCDLAQALESQVQHGKNWTEMASVAAKVDYKISQERGIGGHTLPRANLGPRYTIVPTISYPTSSTKKILNNCKSHSSTISNAVFALCNIAAIRSGLSKDVLPDLPMSFYSALNIRNKLIGEGDWYKLAISYYNITLPAFLPSTISPTETFWHRSNQVRTQTSKIVKSPFLASRILFHAKDRQNASIGFEKADEARRRAERKKKVVVGLGIEMEKLTLRDEEEKTEEETVRRCKVEGEEKGKKKIPNVALMGVSMLGNLDAMYSHASYPSIKLHTLTTGSRQRPSAMLLFAYTFAGQFWMSLGYDENGFEKGSIESWWKEMQVGVEEFLLV